MIMMHMCYNLLSQSAESVPPSILLLWDDLEKLRVGAEPLLPIVMDDCMNERIQGKYS
jgi:hypothetical protein